MAYEDNYQEFEQYLRSSEPDKVLRAKNWSIAIGLQQVDGLTPSDFLVSQAKDNIEGKISIEDVRHRLEEYYQQKDVREKAEADRTLEADGVSERINALLAQKAFTFSPMELAHIHGYLFKGILPHTGLFRTYDITKNQCILDGDTIEYGNAGNLMELLTFDFSEEKKFDYSAVQRKRRLTILPGLYQVFGRFTFSEKAIPAQPLCS